MAEPRLFDPGPPAPTIVGGDPRCRHDWDHLWYGTDYIGALCVLCGAEATSTAEHQRREAAA